MKNDLLISFLAIIISLLIVPIFTYIYFANDLNTQESIMNRKDTGIILFDRNNKPFYTFYEGRYKTYVPLSALPSYISQAVIAIEDKDYYTHAGFSPKAIFRSMMDNIKYRKLAYGGSTITQQLVKNSLLKPTKSFFRKYQEVILANELERRFGKKQILEMYLNSVYFGEGAFGVEAAAQTYFGIPATELSLAQAAFLAALLESPSRLSPFAGGEELAKLRQNRVLDDMDEQKYITPEQKNLALLENLSFQTRQDDINLIGTHFALMVRDELINKYGEEQVPRSGFKIYTTLDWEWQQTTQDVVAEHVAKLAVNNVSNGSAVVIDPKSGDVRALVGSRDWDDNNFGKFNVAMALRQPGSSFKPIVYSLALERGIITPATILKDSPITYRDYGLVYSPRNYDGRFRGNVTVRRALANSLNIPAVDVMNRVGVPDTIAIAQKFGITTLRDPSNYGLALVLGAGEVKLLELTNAYAVFANKGIRNDITLIKKITDKNGQLIFESQPNPTQVISSGVAFIISSILSDKRARSEAFGNLLNTNRLMAVKTGTTNDYKDAWTLGYTPSLTVGVWVGNNDAQSMDSVAGSLGAAPIWKELMEHFLAGTPQENFVPPRDVVAGRCTYSARAREGDKTVNRTVSFEEYFLKDGPVVAGCQSFVAGFSAPSSTPTPTPTPTLTETPSPTPTVTEIPTPTISPSTPTPSLQSRGRHRGRN